MGPIVYNIKYLDETQRNFQGEIDSLLKVFNASMSTYIPDSELSRFNKWDSIAYESPFFKPILELSKQVYDYTGGAFDPTVGPLVDVWGFGPDKRKRGTNANIDSLLNLIGFSQIKFDEIGAMKPSGVQVDFSAVAKGYAVDLVGQFLEDQGITDYMVEIGGEVRCLGQNPEGKIWRIGIENPTVNLENQELFATAILENRSLATSGNYRNFYEENGKKFVHTISPFTGKPVLHSLLSVSVFSSSCMEADALATGFMVLGFEKSLELVNKYESVDAFFIYADEKGELRAHATEGIEPFVRGNF